MYVLLLFLPTNQEDPHPPTYIKKLVKIDYEVRLP